MGKCKECYTSLTPYNFSLALEYDDTDNICDSCFEARSQAWQQDQKHLQREWEGSRF